MTREGPLRVLVLGKPPTRSLAAAAIENTGARVTDCDPLLGDCVMYVRLEGIRFDAFVFVDYNDAVTRGAVAVEPQRSVVIPLFDDASQVDAAVDCYLFRLPKAFGFRTEAERDAVLRAVPDAANVTYEILGASLEDDAAWHRLLTHVREDSWQWETFVADVSAQEATGR